VTPGGKGVDDDVRRVLGRLFREEGIEPRQVVVLTPFGCTRSKLKDGQTVGNVSLAWNQKSGPDHVQVSSVHSFKGLESDMVILAEPEGLARGKNAHRLCYVALSRAKHHLVLIGELPEIQVPLGV
jgi:superfamily I DNA and/or RNA helicase